MWVFGFPPRWDEAVVNEDQSQKDRVAWGREEGRGRGSCVKGRWEGWAVEGCSWRGRGDRCSVESV